MDKISFPTMNIAMVYLSKVVEFKMDGSHILRLKKVWHQNIKLAKSL